MLRKLIIFGNGLGMAIDHSHFSLTNALNTVWTDDSLWSDTIHRDLIQNCIPSNQCPVSEEDLDKLYLVSTSCDYLDDIPHCQNSCHPHLNNPNGGKGDNHGTIQCRTQTSNIKQTAIA